MEEFGRSIFRNEVQRGKVVHEQEILELHASQHWSVWKRNKDEFKDNLFANANLERLHTERVNVNLQDFLDLNSFDSA